MQVVRIFTDMSISPSLSPRQCPDRDAFRAGRNLNLPDKEFRGVYSIFVKTQKDNQPNYATKHQSLSLLPYLSIAGADVKTLLESNTGLCEI